jgi:hypothetical protein
MDDPIGQPNIDPTGQKKRSPADYIDTGKIAQALNVNMEGVPGAPKISDIQSRVKDRGTAATELGTLEDQQQRLRQSIGELESSAAYGKSIGESGVKQYAADTANDIRIGQERIKAENPLPKFIPTQENVQSLSTLFSLLGVISIGGGSKNKLSAMGALNSMTGMMKGWREGRADLWKQEQVKFEKDMAQIKANLDAASKEADLALKMLPYDVQKAEAMIQELVAKTGSQILKQKADLQGVQEAVKFVKELQTGFKEQFKENLETRRLDIKEEEIVSREKIAENRSQDQMNRLIISLRASDDRLDKRLEEQGKRRTNEDRKNDKEVMTMTQGVRSIENLQRQLRDPEIRTGLTSKVAPLLQKINSISNPEDVDFEAVINKELTGNDKTTLFLKDALLETYAIERAAKGGQRLTVQDMKMVGPVLDPTNYKPETYNALLEQRRNVLYNNLQDMGLTIPEIQQRSKQQPYVPYGGDTSAPAGDISTKAKEAFGSYEPNKYEYRVNTETGKIQRKQKGQ